MPDFVELRREDGGRSLVRVADIREVADFGCGDTKVYFHSHRMPEPIANYDEVAAVLCERAIEAPSPVEADPPSSGYWCVVDAEGVTLSRHDIYPQDPRDTGSLRHPSEADAEAFMAALKGFGFEGELKVVEVD